MNLGSLELVRVRALNKGRPKSIMLIHGLFANEGFWLPYLDKLREFRLILVGINFDSAEVNTVTNTLDNICREEAIDVVVAHSLGCAIARLLKYPRVIFAVCDVTQATRKSLYCFEQLIMKDFSFSVSEVNLAMSNATEIYAACTNTCDLRVVSYVPTHDNLFEYQIKANFIGDHFDIDNAIRHLAPLVALDSVTT